MHKKLIAACMALAAFAAFALPATASATNDPQLTDSEGTVTVGSTITATSTSPTMVGTGGATTVTCNTLVLTGTVVKNAGGTVESTISKAQCSGTGAVSTDNSLNECTTSFGNSYITVTNLPLCIRSTPEMATDEFQIVSSDCGAGGNPIKFIWGSTTAGECEYEFTNAISGTQTTNGTQAVLTVNSTQSGSGYKKIKGSFLCPSSWMFNMALTLSTDGGAAITIS